MAKGNAYNQPNAVAGSSFKTYSKGSGNPYDEFGSDYKSDAEKAQSDYKTQEQKYFDDQAKASQVASKVTAATQKPAAPAKPAAPKQSLWNKVVDQVSPNTPSDVYRREQAGDAGAYGTQQDDKKALANRVKTLTFTPQETKDRSDFYANNGINLDEAAQQKQTYDAFKAKYKGQSLARVTLDHPDEVKAAAAWEDTQKKIPKVEQQYQDQSNQTVQAAKGVVKGGLNMAGNFVTAPVEAINKHLVEPFVSAPAGALGSAAADATSGKGFDFRKQYQAQRAEPDVLEQGTKYVDKKLGTDITAGAEYGKKNPVEVIGTTALIVADAASGGALTPFITPLLTGYYGTKYAKGLPSAIKDINNEKDTSKKFEKATELITQGLLLAKGGKDTAEGVASLPTEKVVPGGTTEIPITHQDVVEFSRTSNPNLSPETVDALHQVYNEGGQAVKDALKAGKIDVQNPDVTVPTVYGRIIGFLKDKVGRGEKLTPAEEDLYGQVSNDPVQFVATKELTKYLAKDEQPAATTPAPAITAVPAAPELPPIEQVPGLAHPSNITPPEPPQEAGVTVQPQEPQAAVTRPKGSLPSLKTPQTVNAVVSPDLIDNNIVKPDIAYVPSKSLTLGSDTMGVDVDKDTVAQYVQKIKAGEPIDPVVISREKGGQILVHDGQHRLAAMEKLGIDQVPVVEKVESAARVGTPVKEKNKLDEFIDDYTDMIREIESNLKGGQMVDNTGYNEAYGSGITRTTEHSPFYREYFAEHGRKPPLYAWREQAIKELEAGRGAYGASDEYKVIKKEVAGEPVKASFSGTSGGKGKVPSNKPLGEEPAKTEPKPEPKPVVKPEEKPQPSKVVKKFLEEIKKNKEVAGKLDDKLYALGGNTVADNLALNQLFKSVKAIDVSPDDWTAIYHYAEDRNSPITDSQRKIYEGTIKPLQAGINEMREEMGLKPFKNDEFIHRIAQGRGSTLQRYLEGDSKDVRTGNVLKKTSDSMKTRTWMKLVDGQGNSRIVAIRTPKDQTGKALGTRQVTSFSNGKATPMGALKRKMPDQIHEFYDPKVMEQLEDIAKGLGLEHTRTNIPLKRGDTAAGVSYHGTNQIKTKAASPADTLLHEIGHQIDHRYGLQDQFINTNEKTDSKAARQEKVTIRQELRDLADKRMSADASKSYGKYVRTGEEKMAAMFQAYLYAPEIFQAVAPTTFDKFEAFLKSHPETKPITEIEKSLILGSDKIGDVRHEGEFVDKNGKKWQITNATTKEIEANSNTRYYKQPLVTTAIDFMQTRQALRASKFLDDWKKSPEFLYNPRTEEGIAVKSDAKTIPDGWKTTQAPQFRGYHFEPRTAEVLDDFAKVAAKGDPLGAFTGMNLFLRNTIFYNPLMHVPNIMWHAAMRRGLSGVANPIKVASGVKTSVQALNQVIHKGDLYQTMLREGAPLMSFDREGLSKMIGNMMEDTIQDDKAVTKLAKLAGYANKANFVKAWYKVSSGVTWSSHDFFMLQAMIEEMNHGLTAQQAIKEVTAHIPDYRLPTRFLGSRSLKTTLSNHNVTMFLPYHFGIFKSYANTVRELAGKNIEGGREEEGFKGKAKTSAAGMDKLLMAGLIMLVILPWMDGIAKKIFHDKQAQVRRPGPFTIPYAIYNMLSGKKTAQNVATTILPVPPGTKGAVQLLRNRDDLNRQIWDPGDAFNNPVRAVSDIGHFAMGTVAPTSTIHTTKTGGVKSLIENFAGVSSPDQMKTLVSKLYGQQLNLGVQSKVQQRINDQKNKARDQIANGKGDGLAKQLVSQGILKQGDLKDFETQASWTPMQRSYDKLSAVNKLQVLQKSDPKDWGDLGNLDDIKKTAEKTSKDKNSSAANRTAAGDIVKALNGQKDFTFTDGQTATKQSVIQAVGAYASAFKTSPLTAFNRIFTGQRILRTENGAIIVERLPVTSSQGIKAKLGGKNAEYKLDHTVPLELGGTNAESNLKLVTTDTWASYTPVEDYLGKQLKAGKINAKEATRKILAFKNGSMKASDIIGH